MNLLNTIFTLHFGEGNYSTPKNTPQVTQGMEKFFVLLD